MDASTLQISNTTTITGEPGVIIVQSWMPSISLPLLMVASISAFCFLMAIFGSIQVAREKINRMEKSMEFTETDVSPATFKLKPSSSSQSEYINIDPNNPRIDPTMKQNPTPATGYPSADLGTLSGNFTPIAVPPVAPPPPPIGKHYGTWKRTLQALSSAGERVSPTALSPPTLQLDPLPPPPPRGDGSTSEWRGHSNATPSIAARESSSAPMVMNGLWGRIERVLKTGQDADAKSCQIRSLQYNNNSALRPSSSDSASLTVKQPMIFRGGCGPSLIDSSTVQSQDASSQTDTGSPLFPRKISCRCCRERQHLFSRYPAARRSSSSSLLKKIYSKSGLHSGASSSDLSSSGSSSSPGRPRLSIDEDDISKKLCLSVDERIRRYRLCYSSSSSDDESDQVK